MSKRKGQIRPSAAGWIVTFSAILGWNGLCCVGPYDEQRSLSGALDRARRQKENTIRILFEWSDKQYKV